MAPEFVESDPRHGPADRRSETEPLAMVTMERLAGFIERYERDEIVRQTWRNSTDTKLQAMFDSMETVLAPLRLGFAVARVGLKIGCWIVAAITALGTAYTAAKAAVDMFLHRKA